MLDPCWLQRHSSVASLAWREASFYHSSASLELNTLPHLFSSLHARPIYRHLFPSFQQKAAWGTKYTTISFCLNNQSAVHCGKYSSGMFAYVWAYSAEWVIVTLRGPSISVWVMRGCKWMSSTDKAYKGVYDGKTYTGKLKTFCLLFTLAFTLKEEFGCVNHSY